MKRTERRHLKENEVASTVARVQDFYEQYRVPVLAAATAVAVVVVGVGGFTMWRSQTDSRSREMLAGAMVVEQARVAPTPAPGAPPAAPPEGGFPSAQARSEAALAKFMAVANTYPSTDAGIAARYHAAAMMSALGRNAEAVQRYKEVVERAGNSIYGQMAKLGLADADVAAGKFDSAIAAYRELAGAANGQLPVDGVLIQLGRAYDAAGKTGEAHRTFKRVMDEFPQSPYSAEAKRAMDQIKG